MGKGLSDAVVNVAFQATNDFLPVVILTVALAGALNRRVGCYGQTSQVMQKIGDRFCCFLFCHLGSCFNVNVEFPMWINSKSAVKEGFIKILKHIKQVVSLRFVKVGELFDNIIHIHLFILGVQDCGGKAVWIVPVPEKDCFLLTVCFEGFDHGEIGSHMGNSPLNHPCLILAIALQIEPSSGCRCTIQPAC